MLEPFDPFDPPAPLEPLGLLVLPEVLEVLGEAAGALLDPFVLEDVPEELLLELAEEVDAELSALAASE